MPQKTVLPLGGPDRMHQPGSTCDREATPEAIYPRRLRALQRMAQTAELKGNFPLAASLLKQAAEEIGNAYTNRREFTGKNGKDLPAPPPVQGVAIFALPDNGRG